ERLGAVEGVDVAEAPRGLRPAGCLYGGAGFDGHFVEGEFPVVVGDFAAAHETAEIAVGGEVVEGVVVDTDVGYVGRHVLEGVLARQFQEVAVAGGIEGEKGGAVLEAL